MIDETIHKIICGTDHTFILKKSGELLSFGRNDDRELGLGNRDHINKSKLLMQDKEIQQIVCGSYHTLILKESGELFAFGHNGDRTIKFQ